MNFLEAVALLNKDEHISMKRSNGYFEVKSSVGYLSVSGELYSPMSKDILAEDWYIVKEQPKLHTFDEAFKALKEGKIIKRKSSAAEFYYNYTPNIIGSNLPHQAEKYDGNKWVDISFTNDDILANDWVIVEGEE